MAIKEQYAGTVALGMESQFASNLPPASAWLLKPVSTELDTALLKPVTRTNVWRGMDTRTVGARSYAGTIEVEYDSYALALINVWKLLLEDRGTTADVGFNRHRFEVPRAGLPLTGTLLFSFEGGPWIQYRGVLVERIRVQIRVNQPVRLVIQWKAASRFEYGADPSWPVALDLFSSKVTKKDCSVKINDVTDSQIFEVGFEIIDPKIFGGYGQDGVPTRRAREGTASLTGTLIQYWDTTTVDLSDVMRDASTFKLFAAVVDSVNNYGLELTIPKAYVEAGEPTPIGRADVMMNASFRAHLGGTGSDIPFIELRVS